MFGLEPLPRTLAAALRDVKSDKPEVRVSAVRDLSRLADGSDAGPAIAAIAAAVAGDPSPEVRGAGLLALADAGAKDAIDAVLRGSADANTRVRQMALIALGELGEGRDERVRDVIRSAVGDPVAALRFQGLIAASALELPSAEETLIDATDDADDEVRHIALRLLEERSIVEGLEVRPSDAARRAARARLTDASLRVRLAAAILLGRAGDRAGTTVIVEAVRSRDATLDPEDEQAAIVLAGELGLRDAAPDLARHAWRALGRGSRFAYEARIALARMGDERAKAAILRGLSAFTRDTRTLSVVAAGRANLAEALPLIEAMQANERRAESSAVAEALLALRGSRKA